MLIDMKEWWQSKANSLIESRAWWVEEAYLDCAKLVFHTQVFWMMPVLFGTGTLSFVSISKMHLVSHGSKPSTIWNNKKVKGIAKGSIWWHLVTIHLMNSQKKWKLWCLTSQNVTNDRSNGQLVPEANCTNTKHKGNRKQDLERRLKNI